MHQRAPRVAMVSKSLGAADKMSPERATRTEHVNLDKIPIRKPPKTSKVPVKIESLKDEKRDPGHIPSLPNHMSALRIKKTKSVTPRVKDINQIQPALQQLFKEERDQPDPMALTPQELQTGYIQPQQPAMPGGMQGGPNPMMGAPGGAPGGLPMGQSPGGMPRRQPSMPTRKYAEKGRMSGNTLSEMI
jgi:PAB1-binding protein PBP1